VALSDAWRGLRIGVGLGQTEIRAVALHNDTEVWRDAQPVDAHSVDVALRALLDRAPAHRRRSLICAVGPHAAQLRRIDGVPRLDNARLMRSLISNNAAQYFTTCDGELITGSARWIAQEQAWIGAIHASVVADVANACHRAGLRLEGLLPVAACLRVPDDSDRLTWSDGQAAVELTYEAGVLIQARRVNFATVEGHTTSREGLLVGEALGFADALGAARFDARDPLLIHPHSTRQVRPVPRWRLTLAVSMAVAMILAALVAPGLHAVIQAMGYRVELASLREQRVTALSEERELAKARDGLQALSSFTTDAHSATLLLSELTALLPGDASLLSIRTDSTGGTILLLVAQSQKALAALDSLNGATGAEMVGAVTPEIAQGLKRERVTLRFRWAQDPDQQATVQAQQPHAETREATRVH
jgi:hypothetical protein